MAAVGNLVRGVALACALVSAAGCVTMPSERAEAPPLPSVWRDAPQGAELPVTDWWQGFDDPALNRLVTEALSEGQLRGLGVAGIFRAGKGPAGNRREAARCLSESCQRSGHQAEADRRGYRSAAKHAAGNGGLCRIGNGEVGEGHQDRGHQAGLSGLHCRCDPSISVLFR